MAVETSVLNTVQRRLPLKFKRPGWNPILIKELRSRMRGPRAFLILTGFLLLLGSVAFLLYKTMEGMFQFGGGPMSMSAAVGLTLFLGIAFFEMFLVAFVTPALTAGTISGERESLTYEMLVATPLRPSSILVGKMVAALSYVLLLVFAAVPMLSLVFIFGGVAPEEIGAALFLLLATMVTFGAVGVFWSALLGRTGRATVMSYLSILGIILGPMVVYTFWSVLTQQAPPPALLYANPFVAMGSVTATNPVEMFGFGGPASFIFTLMNPFAGFGTLPTEMNHPAWHWTVAFYSLLTFALLFVAILLVRPVGRRRLSLAQLLVAASLLSLLLAGHAAAFSGEDWAQIWRTQDGAVMPGPKGMSEPPVVVELAVMEVTGVDSEVRVTAGGHADVEVLANVR